MSAEKGGRAQIQYGDRTVQYDQVEIHRFRNYPYCMVDGGQQASNGDGKTLYHETKKAKE